MIEPQIGEIITVEGVKYKTKLAVNPDEQCDKCCLRDKPCLHINCTSFVRRDSKAVIFKEIEEMEVKIQIPDNCELIQDGNTYIVKEKKQNPPRSWREFCKNHPRTTNEAYIGYNSSICKILNTSIPRDAGQDKNICVSKEEAKAFLALMQLRQLRKAWIGDWEPSGDKYYAIVYMINGGFRTGIYEDINRSLSFPTNEMAKEFLECFRDLCEQAKPLL